MSATVREGEEVLLRRVNVWVQGIVKGVDTRYSPPIAYVAWGSRGWRNTKECWIAAVPANSDLLKKVPVEDKQTKKRRMKSRKQKTRTVSERDDYSHDEYHNDSEEEHNTLSSSSSSFYSSSYSSRRPLASGQNKSQQPVLIRFQGRVFTSEEEFMKFNEKWKQELEARRQHEQETFKQQRREFFERYSVERAEMQAEATAERNVWRPRRFRQEDSWSIETEEDYEEENVDCSAWAMEEDYERVPTRGTKEKVVKASGAASSSAQKDKMKEEVTTEHNYSQEREDYGEEDGEEEPLHLFSPSNEEEQEEYQSSSSSASSSFLFIGNDESNVWSFDHKSTNNHSNVSHLDSFTSVPSSSSINFDIDGTTNNDISSRFGVPGLSSGRHQEITDFGLPSSSAPLSFSSSSSFVPSNASYDLPQLSSSTSSHSYSLPVSNDLSSSSSVSLLLENAERNMHSFSLPTSSPSSSSFSFDIEIDEEEENKQKQLKRSYGPPLHSSSSLLRTSFDASSVSASSLSSSDDGGYTLPLPLDADLSQTSKNYSLPLSPHVRSITDVDCFTVPSSKASSSSHSIHMTKSTRNDEKATSDDLLVQQNGWAEGDSTDGEDEASFLGAFMRMQDRKYHHVFKKQQQQSNNADSASSNNSVNHTKKTNNKKKESSSQLKATTTTKPNKKTTNSNNNNSTSAAEGLSKQEKRRLKWEQRQWKRELFKQKQKQAHNWGTGAP
ncbi:hypothetical protein QOT17_017726 [Balamuthia mandrillaris]